MYDEEGNWIGPGPEPVDQNQPQLDPAMLQAIMGWLQPPLTKDGEVYNYDLDVQQDYRNSYQDTISSVADLMNAYISGPGAFSPEAFDPLQEREAIETPGMDMLRGLEGSGGYEGYIAEAVAEGMSQGSIPSPGEITALLRAEITADPAGVLAESLPKSYDSFDGVEKGVNWAQVSSRAQSLIDPIYGEFSNTVGGIQAGTPGLEFGEDGRFYKVSETDSPSVEWFKKRGLPDPREEYGYDWAVQNIPGAAQGAQQNFQEFSDRQDNVGRATELNRLIQEAQGSQADYQGAMARYATQNPQQPQQPQRGRSAPSGRLEDRSRPMTHSSQNYVNATERAMAEKGISRPTELGGSLESLMQKYQAQSQGQPASGINSIPMGPRVLPQGQRPMPPGMELPGGQRVPGVDGSQSRVSDLQAMLRSNMAQRQSQAMASMQRTAADPGNSPYAEALRMEAARRQGRNPAKDAIQQRLQPLFAAGALGSRPPWG